MTDLAVDPQHIVDVDRYPLGGPPEALDALVAEASAGLTRDGVALIEGFLRPEAVEAICAECEQLAPVGHHSEVTGTPYLGLPDESFPPSHPRRAEVRSALTAVAYDQFPVTSPLRAVYEWPAMLELVRRIIGVDVLYPYADPFGALNVAVMGEGDELGWHFDQTDFVVSIALRSSTEGGEFRSATRIRSRDDERYEAVDRVLRDDGGPEVVTMPMRPGTLMLFEGRHSMHQVTPIRGEVPRLVALLAYDTRPDTDSSELLKLVRYGRLP